MYERRRRRRPRRASAERARPGGPAPARARPRLARAQPPRPHGGRGARGCSARKRVEPAAIDEALGELREQGYLDDARYAQRFAEDRRALDGWGAERIERRLRAARRRREPIAAAVGEHGPATASSRRRSSCCAAASRRRRTTPASASARSACWSARATTSSWPTTRCGATPSAARSTEGVAADCATPAAVLRSAQRQTGPRGARKLQQIKQLSLGTSSFSDDGHHEPSPRRSGAASGRARPSHRPNTASAAI